MYLARRFVYHFLAFFHHWYVDGLHAITRRFMVLFKAAGRPYLGGILRVLLAILFAVVYITWVAIPVIIFYYVARNL